MKNFKSHFDFNKQERSGIFFLLLLIVVLQVGYFLFKTFPAENHAESISIDIETQAQIDILKEKALQKDSVKIYPFNPNFITDYKGYALGMSVEEIDRLRAFRAQSKFANSPEEFQTVTQISDSLLEAISPYFKFPEWTQKKSKQSAVDTKQSGGRKNSPPREGLGEDFLVQDLNTATAQDLRTITGIGEKLSARIIKFRDRLGGFLVDEQLYDVYGLEAAVAERTLKRFKLLSTPEIKKINVNEASVAELVKLVYIRYAVAQDIVVYRELNGSIDSFDELKSIDDFPSDKIDRIALYLSL
ncbi:ComEA family DNA-binding protein [Maribacter halichondriae]|uniref:ComEA family DNA-binding protein n=1 Tax=Maribacter halichondriae TaxID=2980554 RepID=UPI00235A01A4|nr:helix-hairpin-helix domain-containing protein [Maribacter sp. Hal144]